MRFAIIESGGKQYRAVEGSTIEVDRLPVEAGKNFDLQSILLMADGDEVLVGTPTVSDILVKATVVDHIKGPKIDRFRYRPKKRIRVRGGHRQQYTRLMIDFIGRPGEERQIEKPVEKEAEAPVEVTEAEAEPTSSPQAKAAKQARAPKKARAEQDRSELATSSPKGKPSARKTEKSPATSSPKAKKPTKKSDKK
jgi:large subunit ribosomal protein L21